MMNLHTQLCDWTNLWEAYLNASRGKRGRPSTAEFDYLLADNLLALQADLHAQTYQPGGYHSFYIHEPKRRLISAAPFRDRVAHHALCNVTVPHFERWFMPESYANRPGQGTHRALDQCQHLAQRYPYALLCDLAQFFPSIDHALLREALAELLPDPSANWLIDRLLASGQGVLAEDYQMVYFPGDELWASQRPRGLPIGNLTSQWWANVYLHRFDQFVKRELGCHAYLRYVDDFILFGESLAQLWEWRAAIIKRLARYRLTLHVARATPRPVTEGLSFLGFTLFPTHRRLKRDKGYAFRRKLKHLATTATPAQLKAVVQGWINHVRYGDTFGLRRAVLAQGGLLAED